MANRKPSDAVALPDATGPLSLAVLRIGVACMWIQNVGWKFPPAFGEGPNPGALYRFTRWAVDYEVFPPYAWFVHHVVLPNFQLFGWLTLFVEAGLGAFLLVGLATRPWALIGVGQCLAITLSVFNAPHEWHWSYFLMILAHLTLAGTSAGRYHGLDGVLVLGREKAGHTVALTLQAPARSRNRAATTLGITSIAGAVFFFTRGDPWQLVAMPPAVAATSLVLGALTCAAGAKGKPVAQAVLGGAYVAGAVVVLAGQVVVGPSWRDAAGTASTFSLWLGLGAGLLLLGLARPAADSRH